MNQHDASDWEDELAALLEELSMVQQELLDALVQKRDRVAAGDWAAMEELQRREDELGQRLEQCHQRRATLLDRMNSQGTQVDSLTKLASLATAGKRDKVQRQVKESQARVRLLRHQSLTNWVLAQRSLLHLSQMLEIIATGGRLVPTYGSGDSHMRGALVDEEV